MKFPVLSDADIKKQSSRLLAAGDADFTVSSAEEAKSKNGNPMIKLGLKVWDSSGSQGMVWDYLLLTETFAWKLKHFFESINRASDYATGEINAADLVGASGRCILKIEKSDRYDDRNSIKDYFVDQIKKSPAIKNTGSSNEPPMFTDEDIPF